MASFTTRERLIKLYSEHGYILRNPKKIVAPTRKKKSKKKNITSGAKSLLVKKTNKAAIGNNTKKQKNSTNKLFSSISNNNTKSNIKKSKDDSRNTMPNKVSPTKTTITPKITSIPSPLNRQFGKTARNKIAKIENLEDKKAQEARAKPMPSTKLFPGTKSTKVTKKSKTVPLISVAIFCAFKSTELKDHPGSINIKNCLYPTTYDNNNISHIASLSVSQGNEKSVEENRDDNNNITEIKKNDIDTALNYPALATFDVQFINAQSIRTGGLANFDVIVFPGGSSARQAQILNKSGRDAVRTFIASGGGFVGFCAGAFLALSHYCPERSLKLVSAGAVLKPVNGGSPRRQLLKNVKGIVNSNNVSKISKILRKSKIIECRPHVVTNKAKKIVESRKATATDDISSAIGANDLAIDTNGEKKKHKNKKKPSRSWEWGHGYANIKFTDLGRKLLWDEGKSWENESEEIEKNVIRMRYNNGPIIRGHDPPLIGSFCRSLTCLATFDTGIMENYYDESNSLKAERNDNVTTDSENNKNLHDNGDLESKIVNNCNNVQLHDSITLSEVALQRQSQQQIQRSTSIINHCAIAYAKPRVPHDRRRTGSVVLISPHPESTTPMLSKNNVSNDRYKRLVQRVILLASGVSPAGNSNGIKSPRRRRR